MMHHMNCYRFPFPLPAKSLSNSIIFAWSSRIRLCSSLGGFLMREDFFFFWNSSDSKEANESSKELDPTDEENELWKLPSLERDFFFFFCFLSSKKSSSKSAESMDANELSNASLEVDFFDCGFSENGSSSNSNGSMDAKELSNAFVDRVGLFFFFFNSSDPRDEKESLFDAVRLDDLD